MKRFMKSVAVLMVLSMLLSLSSCANQRRKGVERVSSPEASKQEHIEKDPTVPTTDPVITDGPAPTDAPPGDIVDLTMFTTMSGKELNPDNEIREIIAEKTGVRVTESWLSYQSEQEAVSTIIASGQFPDYIDVSDMEKLYQYGYLIAWDDYIEKYPNIKELYSDEEWDRFRQDDGHIYWANVFNRFYQKDTTTVSTGQAFWIQARVLEAYGYPKIETLDQYFEILEKYAKDHPQLPNGTNVIPYTCLCEDWKYFCL